MEEGGQFRNNLLSREEKTFSARDTIEECYWHFV